MVEEFKSFYKKVEGNEGSKIVKWDESSRSHKSNKGRKIVDYNPVIIVPIKGI